MHGRPFLFNVAYGSAWSYHFDELPPYFQMRKSLFSVLPGSCFDALPVVGQWAGRGVAARDGEAPAMINYRNEMMTGGIGPRFSSPDV